jgi:hypothetical protein
VGRGRRCGRHPARTDCHGDVRASGQFQETKELRRAQTRPFVVPSIDVEQQMLFMLKIENVGATPAFNVRLDFEDSPRSESKDIEELRMLK